MAYFRMPQQSILQIDIAKTARAWETWRTHCTLLHRHIWNSEEKKPHLGWRSGSAVTSTYCPPKDPSSIPSTHTSQLITVCNSSSGGPESLLLASADT